MCRDKVPATVVALPRKLLAALLAGVVLVTFSGCMTTSVEVNEETKFPVPLLNKLPLTVGLHLPEELLTFVHEESLGDNGVFAINIGDAQPTVFNNLFSGMFAESRSIDDPAQPSVDVAGTVVPRITEMQFSAPFQTRTDYFEVWVKYQFELYDRDGTRLGDWSLTAYGKANTQNYGLNTTPPTLRAAALQACRDAMAHFTVSFTREPVVQNWLNAELNGGNR